MSNSRNFSSGRSKSPIESKSAINLQVNSREKKEVIASIAKSSLCNTTKIIDQDQNKPYNANPLMKVFNTNSYREYIISENLKNDNTNPKLNGKMEKNENNSIIKEEASSSCYFFSFTPKKDINQVGVTPLKETSISRSLHNRKLSAAPILENHLKKSVEPKKTFFGGDPRVLDLYKGCHESMEDTTMLDNTLMMRTFDKSENSIINQEKDLNQTKSSTKSIQKSLDFNKKTINLSKNSAQDICVKKIDITPQRRPQASNKREILAEETNSLNIMKDCVKRIGNSKPERNRKITPEMKRPVGSETIAKNKHNNNNIGIKSYGGASENENRLHSNKPLIKTTSNQLKSILKEKNIESSKNIQKANVHCLSKTNSNISASNANTFNNKKIIKHVKTLSKVVAPHDNGIKKKQVSISDWQPDSIMPSEIPKHDQSIQKSFIVGNTESILSFSTLNASIDKSLEIKSSEYKFGTTARDHKNILINDYSQFIEKSKDNQKIDHTIDSSYNCLEFEKIIDQINTLENVQKLVVDTTSCNKKINDESIKMLCQALSHHIMLNEFNFNIGSSNDVTDVGIEELSNTLSTLSCLYSIHLNFHGNKCITDTGIKHLSKAIANLKYLTTIHLNFGYLNEITDAGIKLITNALMLKQTYLSTLDLKFAGSTRGVSKITNFGLKDICFGILKLSSLRNLHLDFSLNQLINDLGLAELAKTISRNTSIQKLQLRFSNSNISDIGMIKLAEAISKLFFLKTLELEFKSEKDYHAMNITDDFIEELGYSMLRLMCFNELCLNFSSNRKITDIGIHILDNVIPKIHTLEKVELIFEDCGQTAIGDAILKGLNKKDQFVMQK